MQTMRAVGIDGSRVRRSRLALGLTQADLAQRSGISQEAISRIENGKIKGLMQSTQGALAAALGTTAAYLRGDPDSPRGAGESHGAVRKRSGRVAAVHAGTDSGGNGTFTDARETVLDREGDDPLVRSLGRAFDHTRHSVVDTHAVLETLWATDRRLVEGMDLDEAARAWLDAAAGLRREGIPVTTQNVLVRVTAGRGQHARSVTEAREAAATADAGARARAYGVEPGSAPVALPVRGGRT